MNYATAYAALVIMGGLKQGERALIHAAAGGVGICAIQVAKLQGAEVFGTASARSTTRSASRASTTRSTTATRTSRPR